jgi:hypothetical protein
VPAPHGHTTDEKTPLQKQSDTSWCVTKPLYKNAQSTGHPQRTQPLRKLLPRHSTLKKGFTITNRYTNICSEGETQIKIVFKNKKGLEKHSQSPFYGNNQLFTSKS